jgi:uncharacterized DUF497 family protein
VGYVFEWDARKALSNIKKHRVTFDEASTVFGDVLSLLMEDPKHSSYELRFLVMGMSNRQRLIVVAFAERPPSTRIISARLASRQERKLYEQ